MKKRFVRPLLILGALAGLLLAGRWYLSSAAVAHRIAGRVSSVLGVPVELDQASVALVGNSTFRGLKVREPDTAPGSSPWLQVGSGQADLSALDVLRGGSPKEVTLRDTQIRLEFDENGSLLTRLPKPTAEGTTVPRLLLADAQITLDQHGRAPLVLHGLQGELKGTDSGLTLNGTVQDPVWGSWTTNLVYQAEGGKVELTLTTPRAELTRAMLESLPFVSAKVWQQVHASGTTSVDFRLRFHVGESGVSYRVALGIVAADVFVTSIDLDARQVRGQAIIADHVVELRRLQGRLGSGEILTTADLDFRTATSDLQFDVDVKQVSVKELPSSWKMPPQLSGVVSGQATLEVVIAEDVKKTGKGEGVVEQAKWNDFEYPKPIPIHLHSDGKEFHFKPQLSMSSLLNLLPLQTNLLQKPKGK